jgi:hypothetical protein
MNHLTYDGNAKLIKGNAELDKNLNGTILIDVKELSKGTYKMFIHGKGTQQLNAGINDAPIIPIATSRKTPTMKFTKTNSEIQEKDKIQKQKKVVKQEEVLKQEGMPKHENLQKQEEMKDRYIGTFEIKDNN